MKIVLVSSAVPFVRGGARFIVDWLEPKLREAGHEVERFYLPFVDDPDVLLDQIAAFRLINLSDVCDRVICFRPPSYVIQHPRKVLWFIHHLRVFYDLWESEYRPQTRGVDALRKALIDLDTVALGEAQRIFTNSQVVADRLKRFNNLDATPLYPPIADSGRFRNAGEGDEIVAISRIEPHKRQHLLVEAMKYVQTPVRLRLCGQSAVDSYSREMRRTIREHNLDKRITLEDRWINEDEKVERLSTALAVAYLPFDEDSYGYPSLEAAHSRKAVLTTSDAGGTLELVQNGRNGFVLPPDPEAIAAAMDGLYADRAKARDMGVANHARLGELGVDWSTVVTALTS